MWPPHGLGGVIGSDGEDGGDESGEGVLEMVVALESDLGLCCGSGGETAPAGRGLGLLMAPVCVPGQQGGGGTAADM